ncbi:hypothetical protein QFC21_006294 [Naganishia friedmannii]|uniref:Uncharacterized protein n=1 Tax=Naganishia friedmannii TaxID=89922 RepID=A0ACC2V2W8_9TREE|nr:hypothetical protein QFC21_006294 [Naganishia friedmannii]
MPTTPPPLPPTGQFIARTRETCASVREHSGIKVNTLAIDAHLKTLDRTTFDRLKSSHGVSFPLTFPTVQSEINFLAVLALLNTLSAYRAPFHASTGQGAYQNVIKLLFGLYISSNDQEGTGLLSARGLETLDAQTISSIWGVSTFEEKPHPDLPGVTVGTQGGVMHEIVQMVVQVCNETGRILREEGWKDLGEFVASVLEEAEGMEEAEMADWVVQKVSSAVMRAVKQRERDDKVKMRRASCADTVAMVLESEVQCVVNLKAGQATFVAPFTATAEGQSVIPVAQDNLRK